MTQLAKTLRVMVLGVAGSLALGAMPLYAGPDDGAITNVPFSFEGPFGTYDQQQLRRTLASPSPEISSKMASAWAWGTLSASIKTHRRGVPRS